LLSRHAFRSDSTRRRVALTGRVRYVPRSELQMKTRSPLFTANTREMSMPCTRRNTRVVLLHVDGIDVRCESGRRGKGRTRR
jgi:hypothetical protein